MKNWLYKSNEECAEDIQTLIETEGTIGNKDIIYIYSDDNPEGEGFLLTCKYSISIGRQATLEEFTPLEIDLPYRILYKTQTHNSLIELNDFEYKFILKINDDTQNENLESFENFLFKLETENDLIPTGIANSITFNIGQPNTGKSYNFEESKLFKLESVNKYKYLKIPVSGGIGNEYKGLQNTDLAITYDPIKEELRFGEFLQMLMSAIVNPKVPHVVFLDDFHNQDISSLLSEYTPLFKGQQKRKIKELTNNDIFNEEFSSTDEFIKQWNRFIKSHCDKDEDNNDIPVVRLTNRVSGDSLSLVFPSNFYLLGAANFNENTLNIFADWEDRAEVTYKYPVETFIESDFYRANETDEFLQCCIFMNKKLKEILESKGIFDYERYCFGMWKIVTSNEAIIADDNKKKTIKFFFGMIKNALKLNNKNSEINNIGWELMQQMQGNEWFKSNIKEVVATTEVIDYKILHKHNIYEDEI